MKSPANLALLLEGFFTSRLMAQRHASPHTIGSYRDTFRLLLNFAEKCLNGGVKEVFRKRCVFEGLRVNS
jgi:site-specific recombinase XerC